jgi:Uma2 family endonuclease
MSGTTKVHNRIVRNLANLLDDHFLPQGCEVWHEQIKVEAKAKERYYYPDLVVSCSERDRDSPRLVQDPVLIGEVLSDGKCNIDLKLAFYTSIPTLRAFLMVSLHEYLLHLYERRAGKWWYRTGFGKDQQLRLIASICYYLGRCLQERQVKHPHRAR